VRVIAAGFGLERDELASDELGDAGAIVLDEGIECEVQRVLSKVSA